jgi:hypothetical protein
MNKVSTPQGEVKLYPLTAKLLQSIHSFLPFGAVKYHPPQKGADYGIVLKCDSRELYGVKQQPGDCDQQQSMVSYQANTILISQSLAGYLTYGFSGLFMPCAYIRTKGSGHFESGIAFFGYPASQGGECQVYPYSAAYDRQFGHGFTTMLIRFIQTLQQSSLDTGITLYASIGLEVRSCLQLGSFAFGFMIVGPHVVCLKTVISQQDPTWTILRSTGISEVFHMPSVAAAITEDKLKIAKPNA